MVMAPGSWCDEFVEALQEVDGFEILAAAEAVGDPFALLARIVEVQHGRDGVDAQAVDVEFAQPVERVRQQEIADLVAAEVEDERAPFAVLALARVGVFVEGGAVEAPQSVGVAREVAGDPIENHAQAGLMAGVDEIAEVVGSAEARGGRVVAGDLIAPGAGEGVLHDGQQFEVRVAEVAHVGDQAVG